MYSSAARTVSRRSAKGGAFVKSQATSGASFIITFIIILHLNCPHAEAVFMRNSLPSSVQYK
jgi:hypothetical protein